MFCSLVNVSHCSDCGKDEGMNTQLDLFLLSFLSDSLLHTDFTSPSGQLNLNDEPLDSFSQPAQFAKMHSKLGTKFTSEISPFLFKSIHPVDPSAITACLYTNPLWLSQVIHCVNQWPGPASLVVESMALDRPQLVSTIKQSSLDRLLCQC